MYGGRRRGRERIPYHVTDPVMHVMYLPPVPKQNDRQTPVKRLPSRNFVCRYTV